VGKRYPQKQNWKRSWEGGNRVPTETELEAQLGRGQAVPTSNKTNKTPSAPPQDQAPRLELERDKEHRLGARNCGGALRFVLAKIRV